MANKTSKPGWKHSLNSKQDKWKKQIENPYKKSMKKINVEFVSVAFFLGLKCHTHFVAAEREVEKEATKKVKCLTQKKIQNCSENKNVRIWKANIFQNWRQVQFFCIRHATENTLKKLNPFEKKLFFLVRQQKYACKIPFRICCCCYAST